MITKIYQGFTFKKSYKQWYCKDIEGSFHYWNDAKAYVDKLWAKVNFNKLYDELPKPTGIISKKLDIKNLGDKL